jgi:hypothetical protein
MLLSKIKPKNVVSWNQNTTIMISSAILEAVRLTCYGNTPQPQTKNDKSRRLSDRPGQTISIISGIDVFNRASLIFKSASSPICSSTQDGETVSRESDGL